MAIPQVGAIGLTISVTIQDQNQVVVDLTGITSGLIYLRRPNGRLSAYGVTGTIPTAGVMTYVTVAGDLDVPGEWRIQARVTTGTSTNYFSDVQPFRVAENIAP